MRSHEEKILTDAVDLAERLLDEVVRANIEWDEVEHLAGCLLKVAARGASYREGPEPDE